MQTKKPPDFEQVLSVFEPVFVMRSNEVFSFFIFDLSQLR